MKVDPGETVTCTFTNTKRGTVVVKKQVVSVHEEHRTSTSRLPAAGPAGFQLDDDTDPALSDTQTFDRIKPGRGTLSRGAPPRRKRFPRMDGGT